MKNMIEKLVIFVLIYFGIPSIVITIQTLGKTHGVLAGVIAGICAIIWMMLAYLLAVTIHGVASKFRSK